MQLDSLFPQAHVVPPGFMRDIPPPLTIGAVLQIIPRELAIRNQCSQWQATVESDFADSMVTVKFHNPTCPPSRTASGESIMYRLRAEARPGLGSGTSMPTQWRLYPSIGLPLPTKSLEVESVLIKNVNDQFLPLDSGRYVSASVSPSPGVVGDVPSTGRLFDTSSIPVSVKTILTEKDSEQRRKAIQDVLLNKYKPRLVRSVNGGRNNGLGIRDLSDVEFRKEWLTIARGAYVNVLLAVTEADLTPITSVTVHGKILEKHENSPVLNNLGLVYEMDPDFVNGTPADIETYAPLYIGRRKLKYWVCVYYDLQDNKAIITANTVTYKEALDDLGAGGNGNSRLAEYLVADIKLSTEHKTEVPYAGDLEDKLYKEAVGAANKAASASETASVPASGSAPAAPTETLPEDLVPVTVSTPLEVKAESDSLEAELDSTQDEALKDSDLDILMRKLRRVK